MLSNFEAMDKELIPFDKRYVFGPPVWLDGPNRARHAYDRLLGQQVVLNTPYTNEADAHFLAVARMRARLRHTNLIPVYDVGITGEGSPFFTEPYIETLTLQMVLAEFLYENAKRTILRVIQYLLDACKAVGFLHHNGLLHLELNPRNILVTRPGEEVFVAGGHPFRLRPEPAGPDAELIRNSPAYAAPEEFGFGPPSVATDVYGLGGILYEILYNEPPNAGKSLADCVRGVMTRQGPPHPGKWRIDTERWGNMAQEIESICLRALETEQDMRFSTVTEFAAAIDRCIARYNDCLPDATPPG